MSIEEARENVAIKTDEIGRYFKTAPRGDYTDISIQKLRSEGRIYETKNGTIRIKYFLNESNGRVVEDVLVGDVFTDIPDMMHSGKERTGIPRPEAPWPSTSASS